MIENWNMKFWIEVFSKFESLSKISMRLNDEFFLKVIVSEFFKVKGQLYVNIQNVGIQTFLHWITWQCTNWGTSVQFSFSVFQLLSELHASGVIFSEWNLFEEFELYVVDAHSSLRPWFRWSFFRVYSHPIFSYVDLRSSRIHHRFSHRTSNVVLLDVLTTGERPSFPDLGGGVDRH